MRMPQGQGALVKFTLTSKQDSLCQSCLSGVVATFRHRGDSSTYCQAIDRMVRGSVSECSKYVWKWSETRYEHDKMAWILETNSKTKAIGFTPPKRPQEIDG